MSSRDHLVGELDAAHHELLEAVSGLGEHEFEEKWLDRRWGVREIVAHIAGWLGQLGAGLERMSRGERPELEGELPWSEVDKWNEVFASHAKGKRHHEILGELNHAMDSFKQAAAKLPEERFEPGKTAVRMFDVAGIGHFREHAEMVRAWRGRSEST
jgi:hypothetical protein